MSKQNLISSMFTRCCQSLVVAVPCPSEMLFPPTQVTVVRPCSLDGCLNLKYPFFFSVKKTCQSKMQSRSCSLVVVKVWLSPSQKCSSRSKCPPRQARMFLLQLYIQPRHERVKRIFSNTVLMLETVLVLFEPIRHDL